MKSIQPSICLEKKQYNDAHDPNKPLQFWFQDTVDGPTLFIVFYSLACRYGRCIGCNLYMQQSSKPVNFRCLMNQVDTVFHNPEILSRANEIRKVIVSNNGSMLDEHTFSSTALMYFIAQLSRYLPNVKILSLETRPEYVEEMELEFLERAIEDSVISQIEIAVGLEAFCEDIRNEMMGKGLSLVAFENCVRKIAEHGIRLKCYFMFQPVPGVTTEQATMDLRETIIYLTDISQEFGIPINLHVNPTYAAKGTVLEREFLAGNYVPPRLYDVAHAIVSAEGTPLTIFVGLYDEGLAVPGGSFLRDGDEELVAILNKFNCTQDFGLLRSVLNDESSDTETRRVPSS